MTHKGFLLKVDTQQYWKNAANYLQKFFSPLVVSSNHGALLVAIRLAATICLHRHICPEGQLDRDADHCQRSCDEQEKPEIRRQAEPHQHVDHEQACAIVVMSQRWVDPLVVPSADVEVKDGGAGCNYQRWTVVYEW